MKITGLSKLTLLDYPEHIACTVFTPGCNMRCPYCHNAGLVFSTSLPEIPEEEFFRFLESRRDKLEGVCITGGEPTLQPDLMDFMAKIKEMGFGVKLDTNGYNPDILKEILDRKIPDMVAMDIKNTQEKYALTTGIPADRFDIERIKRSVDLLKNSGITYEFRTTVIREFHDIDDIEGIGKWIGEVPRFFLQTFKASDDMVYMHEGEGTGFNPYTEIEMRKMLSALKKYISSAKLRGEM